MTLRRLSFTVVALAVAFASQGQSLAAQGRFGAEESLLLREAATRESLGDLDGAENALRRLLDMDPTSSGALFALERVLRAKGGLATMLPLVDGYLSRREDSGIRSLKLQILVEADSLDAMVAEGEQWIAQSPTDEDAYAEVARAYGEAFGPDRALQVLVAGRASLGGGNALALPMGDHYAARGDTDEAVVEWASAVGQDGSNLLVVRRRVEGLVDGGADAGRQMVAILAGSDALERRRAGTRLALELGLGAEALDLARREADALVGDARTEYLEEISVAATAAGVAPVASWAYGELGRTEENPDNRRVLDMRRAEAGLAAGDTAAALDALGQASGTLPPGSAERRLIEARAIRIAAAAFEMDRLRALWASFAEVYAGAPEIDALAAATAGALIGWGDVSGAVDVLDGVVGPRSSVERAYLLLAGGELDAGRGTLMEAVNGLPPSEATELIQLAGLLGRVSVAGAEVLATAGVQAHLGRGGPAAVTLADEAFNVPVSDRALLLAEAARMADRAGQGAVAADIRARLVAEFPGAPEVGEASLFLARHRARVEGNAAEAIRLLEDLITRQPNAAVVPEARLELERLRSRGS